jgi:predicted nuclease of predicted toxin-antitoxin system
MKLLFDQNLSFKLIQRLAALYPGSTQARVIGMEEVPDDQLWEYARQNGFTIVTQDGDFPI